MTAARTRGYDKVPPAFWRMRLPGASPISVPEYHEKWYAGMVQNQAFSGGAFRGIRFQSCDCAMPHDWNRMPRNALPGFEPCRTDDSVQAATRCPETTWERNVAVRPACPLDTPPTGRAP